MTRRFFTIEDDALVLSKDISDDELARSSIVHSPLSALGGTSFCTNRPPSKKSVKLSIRRLGGRALCYYSGTTLAEG